MGETITFFTKEKNITEKYETLSGGGGTLVVDHKKNFYFDPKKNIFFLCVFP